MGWLTAAAVGTFIAGTGAFVLVLVANIEPQPEYPTLMTDLVRLIGAAIGLCGIAIGAAFLLAAGAAYTG
ncbi:hypothetical protein ACFO5R_18740 [Halosolutus amylolyticus]|uniref:Uncharacterized protein n=1 Tax=Halosolutus amylolyticus TaxID=2932267 RepID=A0ABD5PUI6_9EURY|nr:hypothetical protein [Halosolutus amylolyticus]